jgi:pimeloyl-ACP methyl ester carboxylesterase
VLVTPFDSLVEVARTHFRWLPVRALLRDRFDSAARVAAGELDAPTLIVIAGDDEVVPVARGEALAAAFPPGQVEVERIAGATHNTIDLFPRYLQRVAQFVDSP